MSNNKCLTELSLVLSPLFTWFAQTVPAACHTVTNVTTEVTHATIKDSRTNYIIWWDSCCCPFLCYVTIRVIFAQIFPLSEHEHEHLYF